MRRLAAIVFATLILSTALNAADRPITASPGDPARFTVVEQRCPTFSWGAVEDASAYDLAIYRMAPFNDEATPVLELELAGAITSWTPSGEDCLQRGGRYAWSSRVAGTRDSAWSAARLFQVAAGPTDSEVEQALEVLRRHISNGGSIESPTPPARRPGNESSNLETGRLPDSSAGRAPGLDSQPLSSPTLGIASLTIDQQMHLAASSAVFLGGDPFLWAGSEAGQETNTAVGRQALQGLTTGSLDSDDNTAVGYRALASNSAGGGNTAIGARALEYNSRSAPHNNGFGNTAVGSKALRYSTGSSNVAVGAGAMFYNGAGSGNAAVGSGALRYSHGSSNVAVGDSAMYYNTSGSNNTALGVSALALNETGSYNVAIGKRAALNPDGSNNIHIANLGKNSDDAVIRIGTEGVQIQTFIAGISDTSVTDTPVFIDKTTGQLGVGVLNVTKRARQSASTVEVFTSDSCLTGEVLTGGGCDCLDKLVEATRPSDTDKQWECACSAAVKIVATAYCLDR